MSDDKWELDGCPDDGPAIDTRDRIHVVWPTLVKTSSGEDTIALFYSTSADGRRFAERERIPTEGMPHHPQIATAADGSLALAWDEMVGGKRRAVAAHVMFDATGRPRFDRQVVSAEAPAMYPVVAATGDATLIVWTSDRRNPSFALRVYVSNRDPEKGARDSGITFRTR